MPIFPQYDRNKHCRGRGKKPKAYTLREPIPKDPIYITQAKKQAIATGRFLHSRFNESIKVAVEEMDNIVKERRHNLSNKHIQHELEGWIEDLAYS